MLDKVTIITCIVLILIVMIAVILWIVLSKKKEHFGPIKKVTPTTVAKAKPQQYSTKEEQIQDMLGNNIVPNNDIKIYTNMAQQLEVNQNDFINDVQNSDSAKMYQISNWASRSAQLAAIKEQGLATRGPNSVQFDKELQAVAGYRFNGDGPVPDAYEKYANGRISSAPTIRPDYIPIGPNNLYTGIGAQVSKDVARREVETRKIAGQYNSKLIQ